MTVKVSAIQAVFVAKVTIYGPRLMHDLSLHDFQSAGVFGNGGHESAGLKVLQEIRPRAGKGGRGWFMETGVRRRAFEAWCKAKKLNPDSDEANYGFLVHELQTTEAGALRHLKQTKTLEAACRSFCDQFERPGVKAYASRLTWAKRALPAIQKGLTAHAAIVAKTAAAPVATPPTPSASPAKPKPIADKHAVAEKPAPKPVAKKPVPVRRRTAPVAHHTAHTKAKRH